MLSQPRDKGIRNRRVPLTEWGFGLEKSQLTDTRWTQPLDSSSLAQSIVHVNKTWTCVESFSACGRFEAKGTESCSSGWKQGREANGLTLSEEKSQLKSPSDYRMDLAISGSQHTLRCQVQ